MKTAILSSHKAPSSFHSRGMGHSAQTHYPVGPVVQGKFLLSLGERDLDEVAPQFTHGDQAVESTVTYFDNLFKGKDDQVLRTVQDPDDKGARRMERRQVDAKSGQKVFAAGNLAGIKPDETLELVGHGTMLNDHEGEPIKVVRFGGMTPEELATYLVSNGLPNGYKGVISLTGCSTGFGGAASYTAEFQKALHQKKQLGKGRPTVLGYTGTAHVGKHTHDGSSGMMVQRNLPALKAAKDSLWALRPEIRALVPNHADEKSSPAPNAANDQQTIFQRLERALSLVTSATFKTFYFDGFVDSRAITRATEDTITYYDDSLADVEEEQLAATIAFSALVRAFNARHLKPIPAVSGTATVSPAASVSASIAATSATTVAVASTAAPTASTSASEAVEVDLKAIESAAKLIFARKMPDPLDQDHKSHQHEISQKPAEKGCCTIM
jgi:hypothetical protein